MSSHCKIDPLSDSSTLDLSHGLEVEENGTVLESNPPDADYTHLDISDGYLVVI